MKVLAKVAYKGTNYLGWQKQVGGGTIQDKIEEVLSKLLNKQTPIYASGRTDAGVHARGQYFHFEMDENRDINQLKYALNCLLPLDMHICFLKKVNDDFHARFSAIGKHYSYTFLIGENDPFNNEFTYNIQDEFDIDLFQKAIQEFAGEHNYQNFTSKEEDELGFVRKITAKTALNGNFLKVDFYGNGFMKYMIRYMVGTALAIAKGIKPLSYIKGNLDVKERNIVSFKAPSEGLVLEDVEYVNL